MSAPGGRFRPGAVILVGKHSAWRHLNHLGLHPTGTVVFVRNTVFGATQGLGRCPFPVLGGMGCQPDL